MMQPRPHARTILPDGPRRTFNALWLLDRFAPWAAAAPGVCALRRHAHRRIGDALARRGAGQVRAVERRTDLGASEFIEDYVRHGIPVVFEGAAASWPCVRDWSPQLFAERMGDFAFPVLPPSGHEIAASDATPVAMTVREAMERLDRGERTYVRFLPVLRRYPELLADFDVEWFERRRGAASAMALYQLFIGSADTDTGMHAAMSNNLFVQVRGRKHWRIYSPAYNPALRPVVASSPYFTSRLDAHAPDDEHPWFEHVDGYETTLGPGDILYNPPFFWHQVSNPTPSIGLGFRWLGLPSIWRSSRVQTLLTLLATDPPFWDQVGERGLRAAARQMRSAE